MLINVQSQVIECLEVFVVNIQGLNEMNFCPHLEQSSVFLAVALIKQMAIKITNSVCSLNICTFYIQFLCTI